MIGAIGVIVYHIVERAQEHEDVHADKRRLNMVGNVVKEIMKKLKHVHENALVISKRHKSSCQHKP